jgi:L-threonylcarbamoyladenylate synthase
MDAPNPAGPLDEAVAILTRGGVVVVPSDTCYGLAGDALRESTVARVLRVKGRPTDRPPAVFVPDLGMASTLGVLSPRAMRVAAELLPGPWTILLAARADTPVWLVSPEGLVGLRWTLFPTVAELVSASGLVLTATSANRSGHPPPYERVALARALPLGDVDLVIDGPCGGLPPSTVIDLSTGSPSIRRAGSGDLRRNIERGVRT